MRVKDIYSAETQLLKTLPKMALAATSEELKSGSEEHLEQNKGHVTRQIFDAHGEIQQARNAWAWRG